jgi:hypothetical protein
MQPGEWFGNEPIDLFSTIECQTKEKVAYIMSSYYRFYCGALDGGQSNPVIIQMQQSPESVDAAKHRAHFMLSKSVWVSILCHNTNHWQLICVLNPTSPTCSVLLMDSLAGSAKASNTVMVAHFVSLYIRDIYRDANAGLPPSHDPPSVHTCIVVKQPNSIDCGPYALLNLKHLMLIIDSLVILHAAGESIVLDFRHWYSTSAGSDYRIFLRESYRRLLADYAL